MKNLPSLLNRAVLAVAGALALGACSRGQYAVLPKAPAYLGSAPVAATAPRPVTQLATAAPVAPAPAAEASARLIAAAPTARPATKPVATPGRVVKAVPAPVVAPEATVAAAPAKPTLVQRLALKKLTKKLDKLASQAPQFKQRDAVANTHRPDGRLRTALLVLLIGVIVAAFSGVNGIFGLVGGILVIVGLVLLLLYLLDQL